MHSFFQCVSLERTLSVARLKVVHPHTSHVAE
jgi:hypothetical protein